MGWNNARPPGVYRTMAPLMQDLQFGIRLLRRNLSFTATAIVALALGIGATSAIFSVIYGVLLKPLPYRDSERLVRVYENNPVERFQTFPLSPADFLDYRKQNRVFQDIGYRTDSFACSASNRCLAVSSPRRRNLPAAQQTL